MRTGALIAALAALALPHCAAASPVAAAMDVAPTTLELKPGAVELFYAANHGPAPITVQIEAFDWSQSQGDDTLTPSAQLIASPPMATIAPGARQLIRVMAPPADGAAEGTYRLMVSQLADDAPVEGNAVRILLRFGVPVFAGSGADTPQLDWSATPRDGRLDLAVHNSGTHAVKLTAPYLASGATPVKTLGDGSFVYVLPGATRHFAFASAAAGTALHVAARDLRSEKDVAADVVVRP